MRTLCAAILACLLLAVSSPAQTTDSFDAAERAMDGLFRGGDYPAAEQAAKALLDRARAEFGPDSVEAIRTEQALANLAREQDRDAEALAGFQAARDRAIRALGEFNIATMRLTMAYAVALSESGRTEEALPLAAELVRMAEPALGEENIVTTIWRYNLAGLFEDLGYLEEARAAYVKAADRLSRDTDPRNESYKPTIARQIARIDRQLGRHAEAAAGFARAVQMYEAFYGPDHPRTVQTLSEYALELWRAKDMSSLPQVINAAERRSLPIWGPESVVRADLLALRALLATQGGPQGPTWDTALALQGQAVAMMERVLSPTAFATGKLKLDYAAMLTDTTDPAQMRKGLAMLREAEEADHGNVNFSYGVLQTAVQIGAITRREAVAEALRVSQEAQNTAASTASLKYATRLALGEGEEAQLYRAATDAAEREGAIQDELVTLADLPRAEQDAGRERRLRDDLAVQTDLRIRNFAALRKRHPSLSALTGGSSLSLDEVQAALAPDEALIVVDLGLRDGDRHIVIAVTREDADWAELLWTADTWSSAVADVRAGISLRLGVRAAVALDGAEPEPETDEGLYLLAANFLYEETLAKVEHVFREKAHLYLDLRGPIAALPPALLIREKPDSFDPARADWLIRHHALTVLPSVFSLKTLDLARSVPRAPDPLLAFADPTFDLPEGTLLASLDAEAQGVLRGALQPLPETAAEVRDVAQTLGADAAALRLGMAASEAALKEIPLSRFRQLHFATHGLVTGDVVGSTTLDEPALALTPGQGEDGFLTTSEILGLSLNADLVVLSACNTAVGNRPDAEALSGLAQAFFYAGARALLVSHWPVESRSAVRLMTETFRLRAENPTLRAAEAQRRAMLAMIDAPPDARWSHPAYWAPFVLVGRPD